MLVDRHTSWTYVKQEHHMERTTKKKGMEACQADKQFNQNLSELFGLWTDQFLLTYSIKEIQVL